MQVAEHPLLLDTHMWIWFAIGSDEVSRKVRVTISKAIERRGLYISAISLWEFGMLEAKGRIVLDMPPLEWIKASFSSMSLQIVPITPEIAIDSCFLPGEFHGDPADRLIIASARSNGLVLATKDKNIIRYSTSHHVKTIS
jgi:PIN domain nuclease of toxin-antitoxin system